MARAIELARQGQGAVEPNPMVGCVLVQDGQIVGEGYHQRFGEAHAEVEALRKAGEAARGADAYVTLEPCCHHGKTGPCTQALLQAQVGRVLVGCEDPNPQVAGNGVAELRQAGLEVEVGVLGAEAQLLIAPFAKRVTTGRPWVIAKWAMTLDGRLATHARSSRWISGEASRAVVQQLRGRVDAVLVGRGTAEADDPRLTARPPGLRTATRVVLDSKGSLPLSSQLVQSIDEAPLLVVSSAHAPAENCQRLRDAGAEVLLLEGDRPSAQLALLLDELGRRELTNLLVEGGSEVFGALLDLAAIDEVHAFIAPKLVGGRSATPVIAGDGIADMQNALELTQVAMQQLDDDLYLHGYLNRGSTVS
jgi:diaminohydroxyphosphoribosylaminopyrimidine deaminase/5-amino-6-(5-phosphoribosylamino)uracil reductase